MNRFTAENFKSLVYDPNPLCDIPPPPGGITEIIINISISICIPVYVVTIFLFTRKYDDEFMRYKKELFWNVLSYLLIDCIMLIILTPKFYFSPPGIRPTGLYFFRHTCSCVTLFILISAIFVCVYAIFRLFYYRMTSIVDLLQDEMVEKLAKTIESLHLTMKILLLLLPFISLLSVEEFLDQPRFKETTNLTVEYPESVCISAFSFPSTSIPILYITAMNSFVIHFIALTICLTIFTNYYTLHCIMKIRRVSKQTYRLHSLYLLYLIVQVGTHIVLLVIPGILLFLVVFFNIGNHKLLTFSVNLFRIQGICSTIVMVLITAPLRKRLYQYFQVGGKMNRTVNVVKIEVTKSKCRVL